MAPALKPKTPPPMLRFPPANTDNVKALEGTREAKQLITRYVAKVNEQENDLENLRKQKAGLEVELESRQKELQQAMDALEVS